VGGPQVSKLVNCTIKHFTLPSMLCKDKLECL
jgi:hypothetical protein